MTGTDGSATHLLAATMDASADLRVLDIRDLRKVHEVNAYHPWVHQMTVVANRTYVAQGPGGVMIVATAALLTGALPDEAALTRPYSFEQPPANVHDVYPTADGTFLFVNNFNELALYCAPKPAQETVNR